MIQGILWGEGLTSSVMCRRTFKMSSHQVMESQVRSRVIPGYEIMIFLRPAHKDFGHFYGSSYVATPDGSRTPVGDLSCTV